MATTFYERIAALPVWARLVLEERSLDVLEGLAGDAALVALPDEAKRLAALRALRGPGWQTPRTVRLKAE